MKRQRLRAGAVCLEQIAYIQRSDSDNRLEIFGAQLVRLHSVHHVRDCIAAQPGIAWVLGSWLRSV